MYSRPKNIIIFFKICLARWGKPKRPWVMIEHLFNKIYAWLLDDSTHWSPVLINWDGCGLYVCSVCVLQCHGHLGGHKVRSIRLPTVIFTVTSGKSYLSPHDLLWCTFSSQTHTHTVNNNANVIVHRDPLTLPAVWVTYINSWWNISAQRTSTGCRGIFMQRCNLACVMFYSNVPNTRPPVKTDIALKGKKIVKVRPYFKMLKM